MIVIVGFVSGILKLTGQCGIFYIDCAAVSIRGKEERKYYGKQY